MRKKVLGITLVGCLIWMCSMNTMATDQEYVVDFCDEVENSFTSEELAAMLEEINEDNSITVVFNDEVFSEYTLEAISEIEKNVRQDVNCILKERGYVQYSVKDEHDCYPTGPYADAYGDKNFIYDSEGNLIKYMQLGVCQYAPKRGCSRLVYKYTYL